MWNSYKGELTIRSWELKGSLVGNSPYCLLNNSCINLDNLVLGQLIIAWLMYFFILITCLLDIVLILWGEILSWSHMRAKGLMDNNKI